MKKLILTLSVLFNYQSFATCRTFALKEAKSMLINKFEVSKLPVEIVEDSFNEDHGTGLYEFRFTNEKGFFIALVVVETQSFVEEQKFPVRCETRELYAFFEE